MSPVQLAYLADFCDAYVVTTRWWSDDPARPWHDLVDPRTGEMLCSADPPHGATAARKVLARFEADLGSHPDGAQRMALARMLAAPPLRDEAGARRWRL